MKLYDRLAGVGDHLAGNVDESVGRQFDEQEGGGFGDQIADFPVMREENDDFVVTGAPKTAVDYVWAYDDTIGGQYTDSRDLPGAAVFGTEDSFASDPAAAIERTVNDTITFAMGEWDYKQEGNERQNEGRGKWPIYLLVAGVALYLLAPVLNLIAAFGGN